MVDIMEIAHPHFSTLVRCQVFAIYRDLLPIFSFHPRSLSFTIVHNRVQKLVDSYINDGKLFHQCRNYKMVKRAHHITRLSPFWVESCRWDGNKDTDQRNFSSTQPYFLPFVILFLLTFFILLSFLFNINFSLSFIFFPLSLFLPFFFPSLLFD